MVVGVRGLWEGVQRVMHIPMYNLIIIPTLQHFRTDPIHLAGITAEDL